MRTESVVIFPVSFLVNVENDEVQQCNHFSGVVSSECESDSAKTDSVGLGTVWNSWNFQLKVGTRIKQTYRMFKTRRTAVHLVLYIHSNERFIVENERGNVFFKYCFSRWGDIYKKFGPFTTRSTFQPVWRIRQAQYGELRHCQTHNVRPQRINRRFLCCNVLA